MPSLNTTLLLLIFLPPLLYFVSRSKPNRQRIIPRSQERILILGGSSGIGRAIAHEYASRDAHVCIVGRREAKLEAVRRECVDLLPSREDSNVLKMSEDFCDPEGLLRIRDLVVQQWEGLDTLVVCAGVSALQPLLTIAGVPRGSSGQANIDGLARVRDVAAAVMRGNFTGPLLSAVAYIPLLAQTSRSPSILLISSVASLIPAPTRTLYAASKGSSLLLFQALSIEHPEIQFTNVVPATVEGDFRASAVDGGDVREDRSQNLRQDYVASQCVHAVDVKRRTLFLPGIYQLFHLLYWIFPSYVDAGARKKYSFK